MLIFRSNLNKGSPDVKLLNRYKFFHLCLLVVALKESAIAVCVLGPNAIATQIVSVSPPSIVVISSSAQIPLEFLFQQPTPLWLTNS